MTESLYFALIIFIIATVKMGMSKSDSDNIIVNQNLYDDPDEFAMKQLTKKTRSKLSLLFFIAIIVYIIAEVFYLY